VWCRGVLVCLTTVMTMNNRIRIEELYKLAHIDYKGNKVFDPAKFAELIVKECALLCISRPGPGDDVRSREHCAELIKEHFGVGDE